MSKVNFFHAVSVVVALKFPLDIFDLWRILPLRLNRRPLTNSALMWKSLPCQNSSAQSSVGNFESQFLLSQTCRGVAIYLIHVNNIRKAWRVKTTCLASVWNCNGVTSTLYMTRFLRFLTNGSGGNRRKNSDNIGLWDNWTSFILYLVCQFFNFSCLSVVCTLGERNKTRRFRYYGFFYKLAIFSWLNPFSNCSRFDYNRTFQTVSTLMKKVGGENKRSLTNDLKILCKERSAQCL